MNPIIFFLIGIPVMLVVNVLTHKAIINKTKDRLIHQLDELGLKYCDFRNPGLLSSGHFNEINMSGNTTGPFGSLRSTLYRYLDYKDKDGQLNTVTVKIRWNLFKKVKLEIKPEIKELHHTIKVQRNLV